MRLNAFARLAAGACVLVCLSVSHDLSAGIITAIEPTPTVQWFSPGKVPLGASIFTVNGSQFVAGAVVKLDGVALFPILNSNDSAYNPNAFADARGVLLPSTSLAQFGATLATWMGAGDAQLNGLFPELSNFAIRDLGFLA